MIDPVAPPLVHRLFAAAGIDAPGSSAEIEGRLGKEMRPSIEAIWPEHVASVVDREELARAPVETISALALDDLALVLVAANGDPAAIGEIEQTLVEPLPRTLSRLRPSPDLVDELRQELREKLLVGPRPKLLEYRGRGPLGAWARVVALRLAHDRARARAPETTEDDALAELADASDSPELAQLRAKYTNELRDAFRAATRRLDPESRAVLRSHAIDALTIDQIGALYQVHRATAARWVQQAKASLLDALRDELAKRLGEGHDACDSVVALVRSRIDLSLSRVLSD